MYIRIVWKPVDVTKKGISAATTELSAGLRFLQWRGCQLSVATTRYKGLSVRKVWWKDRVNMAASTGSSKKISLINCNFKYTV